MAMSQLVGYVRKSKGGFGLNVSIDVEAFEKAVRRESGDGREFVSLVVNVDKIMDIINDEREVTSVCQIVE